MNKQLKKFLHLSVWILISYVVVMAVQIYRIPNYQNGESYKSYSPDGRYMMDVVFAPLYAPTSLILTDLEQDRVVQLSTLPDDDIDMLELWVCEDLNSKRDAWIKKPCYEYTPQGDAGPILTLPPSWWSQLHAWLTIKLKGLEKPQLKVMKVHEWYPPVTKETQ